ncbi:MAG: DUF2800 domain-containing protein [Akkermansia sp.]
MSTEQKNEVAADDPRLGLPSASGIERMALCRGSWLAEQACPAVADSQDALDGTRLHMHMEHGTLPESEEEADAVRWCRETEAALVAELLGDAIPTREQRLWLNGPDGKKALSGQADVVYVADGRHLIIDYKFGRGDVAEAKSNKQLLALAVLLHDMYDATAGNEYYCAILQPFASRQCPQVVRYTAIQLTEAREQLLALIESAKDPNAPLRPSVKACKYCRAAATCPAVVNTMTRVTSSELVAWKKATPAQKSEIYALAKQAEGWAKRVLALAKSELVAGGSLPGYKLGKGKQSFKVTEPTEAFSLLNRALGMDGAVFAGCCSVSITKLRQAVHAKRKADLACTQKDTNEWLESLLEPCSEVSMSEGSIMKGGEECRRLF